MEDGASGASPWSVWGVLLERPPGASGASSWTSPLDDGVYRGGLHKADVADLLTELLL